MKKKGANEKLYWGAHAQTRNLFGVYTDVWRAHAPYSTPVPIGEWVTLRIEIREGDKDCGFVNLDMTDANSTKYNDDTNAVGSIEEVGSLEDELNNLDAELAALGGDEDEDLSFCDLDDATFAELEAEFDSLG